MNFLAHAYLSFNNPGWLAGNLFADFVKGSGEGKFPEDVVQGIKLHRYIDRFTDTHDQVKASRKLLFPEIRHYAAVIVDVLYDHFLANLWEQFHSDSLKSFSQGVYNQIEKFSGYYPLHFDWVFQRMKSHDWLSSYADKEYLFESFHGLARRSPGFIFALQSKNIINSNYESFREQFLLFFPELVNYSRKAVLEFEDK